MRAQRTFQRKPHYALKRAEHARHAEANYSSEQPKPLKDKVETNLRLSATWKITLQHSNPEASVQNRAITKQRCKLISLLARTHCLRVFSKRVLTFRAAQELR